MIPRNAFKKFEKIKNRVRALVFWVSVFLILALVLLGYIVYTTNADTLQNQGDLDQTAVTHIDTAKQSVSDYDYEALGSIYENLATDDSYIGKGLYVVLWDTKTGKFHDLYSQNIDTPYNAASVTKLMTALTLAKEGMLSGDLVSNDESDHPLGLPEGEAVGDFKGQTFPQSDLVAALLVQSSNQAAYSLSKPIGEKQFEEKMNLYARKLGMSRTILRDPSGYDFGSKNKASYMSPRDAARVAFELVHNFPEMTGLTAHQTYDITNTNGKKFALKNTNEIVSQLENVKLSKTGYTNLAGGNLVVITEPREGVYAAFVSLKSTKSGRFSDIKRMYDNLDTTLNMYDLLDNT